MVHFNLYKWLTLMISGLPIVWLMGVGWQHPLNAEPDLTNGTLLTAPSFLLTRCGEGFRCDSCPGETVTPLMPKNEEDVYLVELNSSPTLLFKIPKIPDIYREIRAELLIVDKEFNVVYVKPLEMANPQEGVELEIILPNTLSIETGTHYYWKFAFICSTDGDRTSDIETMGILEFTIPKDSTRSE